MVWRLNFLVALLCLTMGNPYVLYYICPLHTFFFFLVYAFMAVRGLLSFFCCASLALPRVLLSAR
jgi:hypothetical protein